MKPLDLRGARSKSLRGARPRTRSLGELLEARQLLDASGFAGNDCAPELDLSAVTIPTAIVGQEVVLDLPALGATVEDLDTNGDPTGDALRWLADPDTGVDFPTGATLSADGVLTWTPTDDQIGTSVVTVIAIDAGTPALADAEVFEITVEPSTNVAPGLDPIQIADNRLNVGTELVVTVTSSAPEAGQTHTFELVGDSPADATITKIDDMTAEVRWTPTDGDVGTADFTVRVVDDGAPPLDDTESFTVEVFEVNEAPGLAAIADQTAAAGQEIVISVSATDANTGQTITLALDPDSPTDATITPTGAGTAEIRWTPTVGQIGQAIQFGVTATDDGFLPLADTESFTVTVIEAGVAPVMQDVPDASVTLGSQLSVFARATDANAGDTLTFSIAAGAPAGVTVETIPPADGSDEWVGRVLWTPTAADAGVTTIGVVVSDGDPSTADATSTFDVTVNAPPAIDPIADQVVAVGVELVVPISATDANSDETITVTFDAPNLPASAQLQDLMTGPGQADAELRWTPTAADVALGAITVTITAEDPTQLTATETFTITVDDVALVVTTAATALYDPTAPALEFAFSEAVNAAASSIGSYSLVVVGGADDGTLITLPSVTAVSETEFEIALTEALAVGTYRLQLDDALIADLAGNALGAPLSLDFEVVATS